MAQTMVEKIMTDTLRQYLNFNDATIERILIDPAIQEKSLSKRLII
jgi:hypothetical protein